MSQSRNVRSTARGIPWYRRRKNISMYTSYYKQTSKYIYIYIHKKEEETKLMQENIDWYTEHNCSRVNKSHKEAGYQPNVKPKRTRPNTTRPQNFHQNHSPKNYTTPSQSLGTLQQSNKFIIIKSIPKIYNLTRPISTPRSIQ